MKDQPPPDAPTYSFTGAAGTTEVGEITGPDGKPRFGVWLNGHFIGSYLGEAEAAAVAADVAENGFHPETAEGEEPRKAEEPEETPGPKGPG